MVLARLIESMSFPLGIKGPNYSEWRSLNGLTVELRKL